MQPWNRTMKNMSFWAYTPIPPPSVRWGAGFAWALQEPYDEIFTAMRGKMREITLQDLLDRWREQAGGSFPPAL